jgi:hypothetical protein
LGPQVPECDEHWQLLLILLDHLDFIFAPVVTEISADLLTCMIKNNYAYWKAVFPSKRLLPKHNFLVHYPEFITAFGPLSQYWTMRFESKHRFGKEVVSGVQNFKNICKTIVE